jgi:hypothetical protein
MQREWVSVAGKSTGAPYSSAAATGQTSLYNTQQIHSKMVLNTCQLWCMLLCLAGPIPAAWGFNVSASFRLLSLANNLLTGSIPDSLAYLAYSSSVFDLSSNKLQGALGLNWYNVTSQSPPRLTYLGTQ